jgi:hypothetical protein
MSVPTKVSYAVLVATPAVAAWLHFGPLLLAALFSYLVLREYLRVEMSKIEVAPFA